MFHDSMSHTPCSMTPCLLPHAATQYWHSMVAAVANQFRDSDIVFAVANEEDYPDDLRYDIISGVASHLHWRPLPPCRSLGLSEWGEEVAVGLFAPGPLKYPMTEELTRDSLTDFLQVCYWVWSGLLMADCWLCTCRAS